MIDSFYTFDFERLAGLIEENYQACSDPTTGSAQPGTCLATFNTDRRITEKTLAPSLQVATQLDLMGNPRSEERRVGHDGVSTCRSRWSPYYSKKNRRQELHTS